MQTQYVAGRSACSRQYDVAESQVVNLDTTACQNWEDSGMFALGRTQAAYKTYRGRLGCNAARVTLQKDWSRGCRRAHGSFLHLASLPLRQLAHPSKKKLFTLTSQRPSQLSRFSTANTVTKLSGRAHPPAPVCPLNIGGAAC